MARERRRVGITGPSYEEVLPRIVCNSLLLHCCSVYIVTYENIDALVCKAVIDLSAKQARRRLPVFRKLRFHFSFKCRSIFFLSFDYFFFASLFSLLLLFFFLLIESRKRVFEWRIKADVEFMARIVIFRYFRISILFSLIINLINLTHL